MARILLMDDDVQVTRALTTALEKDGHEVISATNGRRGIELLRRHTVDVVVTDIVMPDQEGLETITEIRRVWPSLPVIAMSGGGAGHAGEYLEMALMLGAKQALEKPFPMAALLAAVRDALAG
jgi:DNA-binding response OmpR family regulator